MWLRTTVVGTLRLWVSSCCFCSGCEGDSAVTSSTFWDDGCSSQPPVFAPKEVSGLKLTLSVWFPSIADIPLPGCGSVASLFCFLLAVVIWLVNENQQFLTQLFLIHLCVVLTHFLQFLLSLSVSVTLGMPPSVWAGFTTVRSDCLSSP